MTNHDDASERPCWNRDGVYGDRSCEKLQAHAHCRNCEVFGGAAQEVMRRELPRGYLEEWSAHFAQPRQQERAANRTAVVFRIDGEWFALPASMALVVAEPRPVRRLPHRRDPVLLGLTALRGVLYPCISLGALLGIAEASITPADTRARTLALRFAGFDAALPVAELFGLHRYCDDDLEPPPAAVSGSIPVCIYAVLPVGERRAGCLDAEQLGHQLARRIR